MSLYSKLGVAGLALLSSFSTFALAQNNENEKDDNSTAPASSTFYVPETETQFSLNIADDSNQDISFYFTSPAYSWVGVGFGESMKNSLMFIMYPSKHGDNVTLSTRVSNSNSEPTVKNDAQLELLPGTGIKDEMFVVKAVCRNCRVWSHGWIDTKNRAQPMIYAFGPGNRLQSDSVNAPLKRHVRYGKFLMDMVIATGKSGVPEPLAAMNGVQIPKGMTRDHDRANLAHAVMGCLAIFILWPLNVLVAGFFKKIGYHIGLSIFIVVFLIASYGLGISTSHQFNRSKAFNTPHQIFAFISILPILLTSILPIRKIRNLTPHIPRLHTPMVSASFTFLVLTGGLGLHLSSQGTTIILVYTAIALVVFLFITVFTACIRRRGTAYARANGLHNRRSQGEDDDEQNLVLKAYYYSQGGSRTASAASVDRPSTHGRSGSGNSNIYGGGTMPGPQYLLNMHPGVPVHKSYGC